MFATLERKKPDRKKVSPSAILVSVLVIPLFIGSSGTEQTSYVKAQSMTFPSTVYSLSYNPNYSFLAVSYGRYSDYYGIQNKDGPPPWDGGVAIVSTTSWEIIKILKGHTGNTEVIWRPQGDVLATVSLDKTVIFWDLRTLEISARITIPQAYDYGPQDHVAFAWSPDGKRFSVSVCDEAIWIYSFPDLTLLDKVIAGPKAILIVAWSPDGRYLASGGWADTVLIWDMESFMLVQELDVVNGKALAWSPDGKFLATGGYQIYWASDIGPKAQEGRLVVWNTENWKPTLTKHFPFINCLSWSKDSRKLTVSDWGDTALIYDTNTWTTANKLIEKYGIMVLQWNPNSKEIATGMYDTNGTISIWQESPQE